MKIAVFQMDIAWEDAQTNCRKVEQWVECQLAGRGVDLLVLPEMFATGFSMSPERMAQPAAESQIVEFIERLAVRYDLAVMASVAVEDEVRDFASDNQPASSRDRASDRERRAYYNRLYFVGPDGVRMTYDKRHTFSLSGEHLRYESGHREHLVIHYRGVRICPLICYDLRFPVYSRCKGDYDVLVYVASWPSARIAAWDALLPARAIENQCWVVGANRVGHDPKNEYTGHSVVLDYMGREIIRAEAAAEQMLVADIDMQAQRDYREQFPFWQDADKFEIKWN